MGSILMAFECGSAQKSLPNKGEDASARAAFTVEGDKCRNYAFAWRDRWNSVMELFMAGGNYAASEVPFPKGFPETVQTEMAAAK